MTVSSQHFLVEVSPAALGFLRSRAEQITQRQAIAAQRDVEIARIQSFAAVMLAAIDGARATRDVLILNVSACMKDAIAAGSNEVALELARVLGELGRISADVSEGYVRLTQRSGIQQS